jgi:hypothetical protein
LLVAVIFAKFVIVSIISLASAAITNTTLVQGGSGNEFERMIAGAALLVLAAWSPFAVLRLIPMMEVAASTVASQRSTISNAAGSAGIQTPAAYMRQAMDRHSRPSTSPTSSGAPRTAYMGGMPGGEQSSSGERSESRQTASVRSDEPSEGAGRATYAPGATPTRSEPGIRTEPNDQPPRSGPPHEDNSPPPERRPPRPPRQEE